MRRETTAEFIPVRVVTLNVRYATSKPAPGEQPWQVRCPKLTSQLNFIGEGRENTFICLQEALYSQLVDIKAALGPRWEYNGKGRDDGQEAGEYSPIFYRTDIWTCERNETRWLSENPSTPSKGWDAALPRVVTIGQFCHRKLGVRLVVMSTHFDHHGVKARQESAKLLLQWARDWGAGASSDQQPRCVLLGGDFNSTPDDTAYRTMAAADSGLIDVQTLVSEAKRYGNELTYTSFGEFGESEGRIDYLFMSNPETIRVLTYGVLPNKFDDGVFLSDHRPVVADMEISV